jgi:ParB family chromosome partitioning protein
MTKTPKKIVLSASRDIPFNKLVLSQANVRRIKAGVSIEELAEDIARRTLLQSLTVRPILDDQFGETGMFEIPAGGRRYRALELLVKQKRLARTAPIPCVVREGGIAEEDSLAENIQRAPLHPLDQFRAFQALREKGQSEEEIAAAFFVSPAVVRQRLRLAAASSKLLDAYAADEMTLDQLMAFTVSADHERQEQVFDRIRQSRFIEPSAIRRMLTEGAVRAGDKRALFVGLDAYVATGGVVMTDLFQGDNGGWLQDVALVDRLGAEKLDREADAVRAEGWRWVQVAPDLPYGHVYGLRRLRGETQPLSAEEEAAKAALQAEFDRLEQAHAGDDNLPEEVDSRLAEIETALAAFEDRPIRFDRDEVALAGAFVSIDGQGRLRVERGFVRPEDEPPIQAVVEPQPETTQVSAAAAAGVGPDADVVAAVAPAEPDEHDEPEDDGVLKPIPDKLTTELTAHRTLALRQALGERPKVALLAALHATCLKLFYRYALDSCLDIEARSVSIGERGAYGLGDTELARGLDDRHRRWAAALPKEPQDLWEALTALDHDSREGLFAHCVALSVNALFDPYNRRPRALAHADALAEALDLDMAAAGWEATVETYLGRVTKGRILASVREAKGDDAARRLEGMRKGEMAETAEGLLAGSGWLPEPLRTPGRPTVTPPESKPPTAADGSTASDDTAAQWESSVPSAVGDADVSDPSAGGGDGAPRTADDRPDDPEGSANGVARLAAAE